MIMGRKPGAMKMRRRKFRPRAGFYISLAAAGFALLIFLYLVFFTGLFRPPQYFFRLGAAEGAQISAADSSTL